MSTRLAATLAKGLRLLRATVNDGGRSSLSAIARALDMPLATAHRLALTLETEGYLERSRKGYYHAGPSLNSFKRTDTSAARAAVRLRRPLAQLAKACQAFAHFGVLENGMVTYLVKEKGADDDLFTAEEAQLEAYCSALGKVLLAALPPPELAAYLVTSPFVSLTPRTLTEPDALRRELDTVRRNGVAFDRFEVRDDLFCISVPVHDSRQKVIGAISVSLISEHPDADRITHLRQKLRRIARKAQDKKNSPERDLSR